MTGDLRDRPVRIVYHDSAISCGNYLSRLILHINLHLSEPGPDSLGRLLAAPACGQHKIRLLASPYYDLGSSRADVNPNIIHKPSPLFGLIPYGLSLSFPGLCVLLLFLLYYGIY